MMWIISMLKLLSTSSSIRGYAAAKDGSGDGLFLMLAGQGPDFAEDYGAGFFRTY